MQHAIALVLAESASLAEASPEILRIVCETVGWDVGALWVVEEMAGVLRCADLWLQPNLVAANFVAETRESKFRRGIGFPGRAWESGTVVWVADVTQDVDLPRAPVAAAAALHGAVAVPIRLRGEVLAVLEFFSLEIRPPDEDLLQLFDSVGNMMGQFLKRKQAEELLLHAQKLEAVGSLAGGIAHEFNNLLQAISGYSRYAMEGLDAADQPYRDLQQVTVAADRAAMLTRQLLSFARRQSPALGDGRSQRARPGNANHAAADYRRTHRGDAGSCRPPRPGPRRSRSTAAGAAEPVYQRRRCDAPRGKAADSDPLPAAGCCGSPVDGRPGAHPRIELTVADSGCGMSPQVKDREFEPFFTTKEVGQGTGLGLAIVYGVVRDHKGTIEIDSAPGEGTEIRICFRWQASRQRRAWTTVPPTCRGNCSVATQPSWSPRTRSCCKICSAEPLADAGYQVHLAKDGIEAMNLFRAHDSTISLAVLDARMPKLSGPEVAAKIRERPPPVSGRILHGLSCINLLGLCQRRGDVRS